VHVFLRFLTFFIFSTTFFTSMEGRDGISPAWSSPDLGSTEHSGVVREAALKAQVLENAKQDISCRNGKYKYCERKYEFAGVKTQLASIESASMKLQGWNTQVLKKHKYMRVITVVEITKELSLLSTRIRRAQRRIRDKICYCFTSNVQESLQLTLW